MAADAPLAIIAGGGDLPHRIAEHVAHAGREVFILGVLGFVDDSLMAAYPGERVSIGEVGKQLDALKRSGSQELVFAGIVKRPDFKALKLDMKGAALLPKVVSAARKGDDALLRMLVEVFEKEGFKVLGADDVLADLVVGVGPLGDLAPREDDWPDIRKASEVAAALGRFDIGQGAVVCDGLVLAVEAQEGTDLMLKRCADLPPEIHGAESGRLGVLVKRPKPQQERRIDLPTLGLKTVRGAAAAGLSGVAVEAGGALILDRDAVITAADEAGIFIYGYTPDEVA